MALCLLSDDMVNCGLAPGSWYIPGLSLLCDAIHLNMPYAFPGTGSEAPERGVRAGVLGSPPIPNLVSITGAVAE